MVEPFLRFGILRAAGDWLPTLMIGPASVAGTIDSNERICALSADYASLCASLRIPCLDVFSFTSASPVWTLRLPSPYLACTSACIRRCGHFRMRFQRNSRYDFSSILELSGSLYRRRSIGRPFSSRVTKKQVRVTATHAHELEPDFAEVHSVDNGHFPIAITSPE